MKPLQIYVEIDGEIKGHIHQARYHSSGMVEINTIHQDNGDVVNVGAVFQSYIWTTDNDGNPLLKVWDRLA